MKVSLPAYSAVHYQRYLLIFGDSTASRALQFVRSTPGVVTTAPWGMKQIPHVEENLKTAQVSPAPWEQYSKLFQNEEPS